MNREILFRGKSKYTREWIEGYYLRLGDQYHYLCTVKLNITKGYPEFAHHEVLPETVGQYTGLTDKNGNKIFEGDIVRFRKFNEFYTGRVLFNRRTAGFEIWWNIIVGAYGEKATHNINFAEYSDIEVLGNIIDNPELLGGI